jgi:hypothetical protein
MFFMNEQEKQLTEKESLELIATMINKAKDAYYDTGISAIMWGALVAFCSLVKFSELHFGYRLPFDIYWLTVIGIVPQIFIARKEKKERTVRSYDDAFMHYLWLGFGITLGLLTIVINVIFNAWNPVYTEYSTLTGHAPSFRFYEFIGPLFLILYGLPTFVTGASFRFIPMLWGGIICWVACVIALFTNAKIDLLLIALSAICAWLLPGLLIERDYRKAKQRLKEFDV